MLGFTASAAGVFIGAKYRALDSCKTQTHTHTQTLTHTGLPMRLRCLQPISRMRCCLVCLCVAGRRELFGWLMVLFFRLRGKITFYTGARTYLLRMQSTDGKQYADVGKRRSVCLCVRYYVCIQCFPKDLGLGWQSIFNALWFLSNKSVRMHCCLTSSRQRSCGLGGPWCPPYW